MALCNHCRLMCRIQFHCSTGLKLVLINGLSGSARALLDYDVSIGSMQPLTTTVAVRFGVHSWRGLTISATAP